MAITPGVASALGGTTTTTSFTITIPATVNNGDVLTVWFTHRGTGNGTVTDNSGVGSWTRKGGQIFNTSFSLQCYWKRVTNQAAERGATITGSGLTDSCAGVMVADRGVISSGDPFSQFAGEDNASGNETHAQITTPGDGHLVGLAVGNTPDLAVTSQSSTSPGALAARAERLSTGGTDASIAVASAVKAAAGATGSLTWAQTNAASGSIAYSLTPEPDPPIDDDWGAGYQAAVFALAAAVALSGAIATSARAARTAQDLANSHQDERHVAPTGNSGWAGLPSHWSVRKGSLRVHSWGATDDIVPQPAQSAFEVEGLIFTVPAPRRLELQVFQHNDEIVAQPAQPALEEVFWDAHVARVRPTIVLPPDPVDEQTFTQPAPSYGNSGRTPPLLWAVGKGGIRIHQIAADDVIVPQPSPVVPDDQAGWEPPFVVRPTRALTVFEQQDERVAPAATIAFDEGTWAPPITSPPTRALIVFEHQDERVAPAATIAIDEGEWTDPTRLRAIADVWIPVPWQYGAVDGSVWGPIREEYDELAQVRAVARARTLDIVDVEFVGAAAPSRVDEEYAVIPTVPARRSISVAIEDPNDLLPIAVTAIRDDYPFELDQPQRRAVSSLPNDDVDQIPTPLAASLDEAGWIAPTPITITKRPVVEIDTVEIVPQPPFVPDEDCIIDLRPVQRSHVHIAFDLYADNDRGLRRATAPARTWLTPADPFATLVVDGVETYLTPRDPYTILTVDED